MPKNYSHPPEKDCGTEKIRNREAERIIIFGSFNRWLWFKNILSDILKLKTQAIRISHTGTASCRLWVEERYGYALGKQYKSQPVFYGWISVIPSLKYSQIREDLLRFCLVLPKISLVKNLRPKSRRFLLDFRWLSVQEGWRLSNSKRRKASKRTAFGRVRIYAVSLSIVRPLRCREMRIVLKTTLSRNSYSVI